MKILKKILCTTMMVALVLALGATSVLAAGHGASHHQSARGENCTYAVSVCRRDGSCRTDGTCPAWGGNYVDADGDGVCDYYGTCSGYAGRCRGACVR